MCTALTLTSQDGLTFLGRNMDLDYDFNQSLLVIPQNHPIKNTLTGRVGRSCYGVMGMGTLVEGHPLLADGYNEMGLSCAGLNFPGYAHYSSVSQKGGYNMAPYDFILWVLTSFATVQQVRQEVNNVCLVSHPFSDQLPLPSLHWMISDNQGSSLVVEQTELGIHCYDNTVGVLSNSPDFPWHMTNLNQYVGLSSHSPQSVRWGEQSLSPDGLGLGLRGLPGDSYPASRFVRATYLRTHAAHLDTGESTLSTLFHILDNLAMPDGSVITPQGRQDTTRYSAVLSLAEGIYYYKTHTNAQITALRMTDGDIAGKKSCPIPSATSSPSTGKIESLLHTQKEVVPRDYLFFH